MVVVSCGSSTSHTAVLDLTPSVYTYRCVVENDTVMNFIPIPIPIPTELKVDKVNIMLIKSSSHIGLLLLVESTVQ